MKQPMEIPGFELIEKIGQGGMAVVWKARQVSLDRIVAIKLLNPLADCRSDEQQRLQVEAHAAAHLKHPGIVQVYDAGIVDGIFYFVMEFVAGYSVGQWLRRKQNLPAEDALVVAECVAQALHYAWTHSAIIHCDIKPDNVMVDLDGTIKVADLGLARTIGVVDTDPDRKIEVMGTPGFISPEQSGGMDDLDCRADIYSLGAMLYNLTTGKRLFEQHDDTVVMDMQVTGHEKDPLLVRPDLPIEICWLIEKMLVKDRSHRYPDWESVLEDIERVKAGRLPVRPYPPAGNSTVTRCEVRVRRTRELEQQLQLQQHRYNLTRRLPVVAGLAALALATLVLWADSRRKSRLELAPDETTELAPDAGADLSDGRGAHDTVQELYAFVLRWIDENPEAYDEAIRRLTHVAESARGTVYGLMAEDKIVNLRASRQAAVDKAWETVTQTVETMKADNRFHDAATYALNYRGPWQTELAPELQALADEMSRMAEAYDATHNQAIQVANQSFNALIDEIVDRFLDGNAADALSHAEQRMDEPLFHLRQNELAAVLAVLRAIPELDREVLASFDAQRGKDVVVEFTQGPRNFTIRGVREGRLRMEQRLDGGARVEFEFGIEDLASNEYLARLDRPARHEVALLEGWHRYRAADYEGAAELFGATHPLLSSKLQERVRLEQLMQREENAHADFKLLLRSLDINLQPPEFAAIRTAVQNLPDIPVSSSTLQEQINRFSELHRDTDFYTSAAPVFTELADLLEREDAGRQAPPTVASAEALNERDLTAVLEMLINRNPELFMRDIQVLRDDHGRAYGLEIQSRALRDIGPLAPLRELKVLRCGPSQIGDLSVLTGLTQLTELSIEGSTARDFQPIRALQLQHLSLPRSGFSDVGMLRRMPLRELNLSHTAVRDISGLRGLGLRALEIEETRVFALHALSGMPLERLNLAGTQVRDINLLRGMTLQDLNLARTGVFDFSVLKSMPLRALNLAGTQFRDLALLEGMPLQSLDLSDTRISDISLLRDLPLRHLSLRNTPVRDLSPLQGSILQSLFIEQCRNLRTLDFVEGMPLRELRICGSGISTLAGLQAPALQIFHMQNTEITDISPLRRLPIRRLFLQGSPVEDYSPLVGMPLEELTLNTRSQSARDVLGRINTLRRVNHNRWPPERR